MPCLHLHRLTLRTSPSAVGHVSPPPSLLAGTRGPPSWHRFCLYAAYGGLPRGLVAYRAMHHPHGPYGCHHHGGTRCAPVAAADRGASHWGAP